MHRSFRVPNWLRWMLMVSCSCIQAAATAPSVAWLHAPPSTQTAGVSYFVAASGADVDGNLDIIWVDKNGAPFAYNFADNGDWGSSGNPTWDNYDPADPKARFKAWSTDTANERSSDLHAEVNIQRANMTQPTSANISSAVAYTSINQPAPVSDDPNNNGGFVWVVAGHTNWGTGPWTPPAEGTYDFYIAEIADGNHVGDATVAGIGSIKISPKYTITVQKANQSTPLSIGPSNPVAVVGQQLTLTANGGDGSGNYQWGGAASGSGSTKPVTFTSRGSGTAQVTLSRDGDSAFNPAGPVSANITINKANQSAVSVSPTAVTIAPGQTVTLTPSGGTGTGLYSWSGAVTGTTTGAMTTPSFPVVQQTQVYSIYLKKLGDNDYNDSPNQVEAQVTVNPIYYSLTVNAGTGTGSYTQGTMINLTATPPAGRSFTNWSMSGAGSLSSTTSPTPQFTMGAGNATLTANHVPILYTLSVVNGTGGGTFSMGQQSTLTANTPPVGQLFSHWSITSGLGSVSSATSTTTTFTMSTSNATVQAVYYTPAPPVLVGLHGAGKDTPTNQSVSVVSWQLGNAQQTTTTATGTGAGSWTAAHQYRSFTPGIDYKVKISGTSHERELRFEVPSGYTLYINDAPYTNTAVVNLGNFGGATQDSAEKTFFLVASDGTAALRGGFAIDPQLASDDVIWAISLGRAPNGRTNGALTLRKTNVTNQAFNLDALTITNPEVPGTFDIFTDADAVPTSPWNYPRRFLYAAGNCWLWLDDKVPGQPTSYVEIKAYDPLADPEWDSSVGTYKFVKNSMAINPFARYAISSNPPSHDTLTITKNKGTAHEVSWTLKKTISGGNTEWLLKSGTAQGLRVVASVSGDTTTEEVTIEDGAGAVAQRFRKVYQMFPWGRKELVSETNDPNGFALQTLYAYGTSNGSYGKLVSVKNPDGTFAKYDYSSDHATYGKLSASYARWKDTTASVETASTANSQVTAHTYAPVYLFHKDAMDGTTTTVPVGGTPTIVAKAEQAPNFGAPTFNGKKTRLDTVKAFFGNGSSDYLTTTRLTYHPEETANDLANRLISETAPDGTKISLIFYQGKFTDNGDANTTLFARDLGNPALNTLWGEYRFSGFATQVSGSVLVNTFDGQPIHPLYMVPNKSVVSLMVMEGGRPARTVQYAFTGASGGAPTFEFVGSSKETIAYDATQAVATATRTDHRGGLSKQIFTYGRLTKEVTNDGMEVDFQYNAQGWLIRRDLQGMSASGEYAAQSVVYTHYTYDAAGRKIGTKVSDSSSPSAVGPQSSFTYDTAGRLASETSAVGLQTTYVYDLANRRTTSNLPGGATKIVETYADGTLKMISGTGVVPEFRATSVAADGKVTLTAYILRQSDLAAPTNAPRWTSFTSDWLGRTKRVESPSAGGGTIASDYTYNAKGQHTVVKTTDVATGTRLVADTLIEYNAHEEAYRSGLDVDPTPNGASQPWLNPATTDRISEGETVFEKDSGTGTWWLKQSAKVYNRPNEATALPTGTVKARLNKFSLAGTNVQAEVISSDLLGNEARETVAIDRAARLVTGRVDVSDSSADSLFVVRNGLMIKEQTASNLAYTHAYDSLRRLVSSADPRIDGATLAKDLAPRMGYYDGTAPVGSRYQVAWTKDAVGNQSSYGYSTATARLTSVQAPSLNGQSGKYTYYDYTMRGELYREWGHLGYPVETAFNDYGEAVLMKTFRGGAAGTWTQASWPATPPTPDLTKWVLDTATGVLKEKYDAANLTAAGEPVSGATKVAYSYNKLGQIKTRTWQRGVTTTYNYRGETGGEPLTAELKSMDYSTTGTNPDVSFTYDRLGQTTSVVDASGSRAIEYSPTTNLTEKITLPALLGSRVMRPKFDTTGTGTRGRSTGFSLGTLANPTLDYDVSYGYDAYGRPNSVIASPGTANEVTFSYGYVAASDLIANINETVSGWAQIRNWHPTRNLLQSIGTLIGATNKATFAYSYDEWGRRTSVVQSGKMFERYVGQGLVTKWDYNDRSEVAAARTYHGTSLSTLNYPVAGREHTFEFDNAGNRTVSRIDNRETGYAINNLNQITARTTPGKVEVTGLAPTGSTVKVNNQDVTRQGDYYHKAVDVDNSAGSVNATMTVTSSAPSESKQRKTFVPKATLGSGQEWQYDADGNLTRDDRWIYTWDAENRLLTMETRSEMIGFAIAAGDARRVEFTYDYAGRRVRKLVRTWNGGSFSNSSTDTRFIYNGWNLVAEYDATPALIRTFTWGMDLSGSAQGAGGIAGLLMSRQGSTQHVYAYDGNGNVVGVMNRATGVTVAEYEYSPFGETIRATGPDALTNPFRFSTKYTDDETGLVYYGLRYYSPAQGRFLGRDPIGEAGGRNLYGFVGNNPINAIDYLGAFPTLAEMREAIGQALSNIGRTVLDTIASIFGGPSYDDWGGYGGEGGYYYGGYDPGFDDYIDYIPDDYIQDIYNTLYPPRVIPPFVDTTAGPTFVSTTVATGTPSTVTPPSVQPVTPTIPTATPAPGGAVTGTPTDSGPGAGNPTPPTGIQMNPSVAATTPPPPVVNPPGVTAPTVTPGPQNRPVVAKHSNTPAPKDGYWNGVLDVFKGYGDAAVGTAKGLAQVATHPIESARGIANAVMNPVATAKAIYNDTVEKLQSNRGAGEVVGGVLIGVLTGGTAKAVAESAAIAKVGQAVKTAINVEKKIGCFVAGTLISTASGAVAIETIQVGSRVLTSDATADSTSIDPSQWRKVSMSVPLAQGRNEVVEIIALRPLKWVEEHGVEVGAETPLEIEEMGVRGIATIVAIEPCPVVQDGLGRVVLATMTHISSSVIDLRFDGRLEALRPTVTHPLFSATRGEWVPAGEVKPGELLVTSEGSVRVASTATVAGSHRVFNLEVEAEHCYFAGEMAVLSHNSCGGYVDLTDARGRQHILVGDGPGLGGGHRPGLGKSGKSEFPAGWSDERIIHEISDIATDPNVRWSPPDARGYITGSKTVDGVDIKVVVDTRNHRIVTGFPTNLPRNP